MLFIVWSFINERLARECCRKKDGTEQQNEICASHDLSPIFPLYLRLYLGWIEKI